MKNTIKRIIASTLLVASLVMGAGVVAALPDTSAYAANCTGKVGGKRQLNNAVQCAKPDGAPEQLFGGNGIFNTIANILIFIVGIIAVIMLIIGGIRYAVSGGDESSVKAAKNTILYAIVGLIVAFLAFAIVNFVTTQLQEGTAYIRSYLP